MKEKIAKAKKSNMPDNKLVKALHKEAAKAAADAKLSRVVTKAFTHKPTPGGGKKAAKAADKKAKHAKKKARGLLKKAATQVSKEKSQKEKATKAKHATLARALAHKKHAQTVLRKAHERVVKARSGIGKNIKPVTKLDVGLAKAKQEKRRAQNALFAAKNKADARAAEKKLSKAKAAIKAAKHEKQ